MKRIVSIDQALRDRNLLGAALGPIASWEPWIAVLRASFGLPLSDAQREVFASVAGNRTPPTRRVSELWGIGGRRIGKTHVASGTACYIGAIEQHKLSAGEVGYVLLLAPSRAQASIAYQYVLGYLESSPILRQQIEGVTAEEVRLKGNIVISTAASSYRTIRGRALLAVVADEVAYFGGEDSAQPAEEIFRACQPALIASRGMWVGVSTGYRRSGLLYEKWREHFGKDGDDVLVISAASTQLNPTLDAAEIERAKASDPEVAEAEWMGGFRNDLSGLFADDVLDRAVERDRPVELPPVAGVTYRAFTDCGGSGRSDYCVAIAHREVPRRRLVVDLLRSTSPPYDPHAVTADYAALLRQYPGCTEVVGDRYSAAWVETAWRDSGIRYVRATMAKSELYISAVGPFMRGIVSLPNLPRLVSQLRSLERRTRSSGKDTVESGGQADDLANVVAGVVRELERRRGFLDCDGWRDNAEKEMSPQGQRQAEAERYMRDLRGYIFQVTGHWP
jgi:hypothetical protein